MDKGVSFAFEIEALDPRKSLRRAESFRETVPFSYRAFGPLPLSSWSVYLLYIFAFACMQLVFLSIVCRT